MAADAAADDRAWATGVESSLQALLERSVHFADEDAGERNAADSPETTASNASDDGMHGEELGLGAKVSELSMAMAAVSNPHAYEIVEQPAAQRGGRTPPRRPSTHRQIARALTMPGPDRALGRSVVETPRGLRAAAGERRRLAFMGGASPIPGGQASPKNLFATPEADRSLAPAISRVALPRGFTPRDAQHPPAVSPPTVRCEEARPTADALTGAAAPARHADPCAAGGKGGAATLLRGPPPAARRALGAVACILLGAILGHLAQLAPPAASGPASRAAAEVRGLCRVQGVAVESAACAWDDFLPGAKGALPGPASRVLLEDRWADGGAHGAAATSPAAGEAPARARLLGAGGAGAGASRPAEGGGHGVLDWLESAKGRLAQRLEELQQRDGAAAGGESGGAPRTLLEKARAQRGRRKYRSMISYF